MVDARSSDCARVGSVAGVWGVAPVWGVASRPAGGEEQRAQCEEREPRNTLHGTSLQPNRDLLMTDSGLLEDVGGKERPQGLTGRVETTAAARLRRQQPGRKDPGPCVENRLV